MFLEGFRRSLSVISWRSTDLHDEPVYWKSDDKNHNNAYDAVHIVVVFVRLWWLSQVVFKLQIPNCFRDCIDVAGPEVRCWSSFDSLIRTMFYSSFVLAQVNKELFLLMILMRIMRLVFPVSDVAILCCFCCVVCSLQPCMALCLFAWFFMTYQSVDTTTHFHHNS